MKSDKDTENKQFIVDALKGAGLFALGVVASIATVLGVQTQMGKVESSDDEDDPDIIDSV